MKSYWLNNPVKDMKRSMDFFEKTRFEVNEGEDGTIAQVMVNDQAIFLFIVDVLQSFTGGEFINTGTGNELWFLSIWIQMSKWTSSVRKSLLMADGYWKVQIQSESITAVYLRS